MSLPRSLVLSFAALSFGAAQWVSAVADIEGLDLQLVKSVSMDQMGNWGANPREFVPVYDNTTAPQAVGVYLNGGAVSGITDLVADDTTPTAGGILNEFTFSVANVDPSTAISARPRIRFWQANGAGGGPGTYLFGFSFNPIAFPANSLNLFTTGTGLAANNIVLPAATMWWGLTFDNVGTSTTNAQLNSLGQVLIDPPSIGSSNANLFWESSGPGSFVMNDPPGATASITPVSNFAWEYQVVPEPATLSLIGLGGLVILSRRRA